VRRFKKRDTNDEIRDTRHVPLVIAHRGASAAVPENTCLAVTTAIDLGADMVEVDVQLTADAHPVIFHDWHCGRVARSRTLSRRKLASLDVANTSLRDLQGLDVGLWKARKYIGLSIPTLAELLAACGGRVALNLELKVAPRDERRRPVLVERVSAALERYAGRKDVLLSSFDAAALRLTREQDSSQRIGVLPQDTLQATMRLADRLDAYSVHLRCGEARPAVIRAAHEQGRRVFAYTADRAFTMRRLIAAGIDGIFTNQPERLAQLVKREMGSRKRVNTRES
jgi:glycerophosphoryl diester phosphodiesterase